MKNEFQQIFLLALAGFSIVIIFLFRIGTHFTPSSIVYASVGFFVFWVLTGCLYSFVRYRIKAYSVEATSEHLHRLIYREKSKGFIELFNEACRDNNGHYFFVVHVPTEDEWRQKMPEWAKERRREIMQRIMDELKTSDFRYPGYADD